MKYLIKGLTNSGLIFRPSDWSERLCSVMAEYRTVPRLRIVTDEAREHKTRGYSNCIMPTIIDGVKSVILDTKLKDIEILAFEFVMNFAQDNDLVVEEYSENQILDAVKAA